MFSKRSAVVFLPIVMILTLAVLFSSCGGSSGGGTSVDNSRANGIYKVILMKGGYGGFKDMGAFTFDGAGTGTFVSSYSSSTGAFTYSVTTDNTITLGSTLIGNMRSGGTFFVATDVTPGNLMIVIGIKESALSSEPSNTYTYMSGYYKYTNSTGHSSAGIISAVTASPASGQLTLQYLLPVSGPSFTTTYSLALSNGTFSSPGTTSNLFGAISSDKEVIIMGDVETGISTETMAIVGLRLPGTGMTAASVNGTYIMHELRDNNALAVGVNTMGTSRGRLVMSGGTTTGTATYTELATSGTPTTVSQTFGYTMQSNGTFTIEFPGFKGVALKDGSVFTLVDYDPADNNEVSFMVGVKQ